MSRIRGQALVEFALLAPVLMLILLGILGGGLYFLSAVQQASAAATVAGWSAANPSADPATFDAFASSVGPCPGAVATFAPGVVTVTLTCPTLQLLPMLPANVVTTAKAFVP